MHGVKGFIRSVPVVMASPHTERRKAVVGLSLLLDLVVLDLTSSVCGERCIGSERKASSNTLISWGCL